MKSWFIIALLANIGLFGWYQLHHSDKNTQTLEPEEQAQQIHIVSEQDIPPASPSKPAEPVASKVAEAEQAASVPEAPASTRPPETPAATALVCFDWGPVPDAIWNQARAGLKALRVAPVKPVMEETADKYWVYIPPQGSLPGAQKKGEQLKALNVTDFFIIQDQSKWQFAISLGIFSSREAADKQLGALQAQGVRSAVVGAREPVTRTWKTEFRKLDADKATRLTELVKSLAGPRLNKIACSP